MVKPDDEICAVICRDEPSCVGFARDPEFHWCVWFDNVAPEKTEAGHCSSVQKTQYLKNWQGKAGPLWEAIEKIHVFDKAIMQALEMSDKRSNVAHKHFVDWMDYDAGNSAVRLALEDKFADKMLDYKTVIVDMLDIRKQYLVLQREANKMVRKEAEANPPMKRAPKWKPKPADPTKPTGLAEPLPNPPLLLHWKDFPNSQDTAWSQLHPECPMGTPCVCDCRCRGPPPQNFVEVPPVPKPCPPPPPPPNPFMLTSILR